MCCNPCGCHCDTIDEQKVQPCCACCCCHWGLYCPCSFPGCLGAEGNCGLCCLQCEVCCKPKPPLSYWCCGPNCNGGCQGLKLQGQFFLLTGILKFPCDSEVPCIINTLGYTWYPSAGKGCCKTVGEIRAGQAPPSPATASTEPKGAPESQTMER